MSTDRPTICKVCGDPFHVDAIGRTREFCSNACRQYSYRKNRLSNETVTKRGGTATGRDDHLGSHHTERSYDHVAHVPDLQTTS